MANVIEIIGIVDNRRHGAVERTNHLIKGVRKVAGTLDFDAEIALGDSLCLFNEEFQFGENTIERAGKKPDFIGVK